MPRASTLRPPASVPVQPTPRAIFHDCALSMLDMTGRLKTSPHLPAKAQKHLEQVETHLIRFIYTLAED